MLPSPSLAASGRGRSRQELLGAVEELARLGSGSRALWTSLTTEALVRGPLTALEAVPAARDAALAYAGLLAFDAVQLRVIHQQDTANSATRPFSYTALEDAVDALLDQLRRLLETEAEAWRPRLLVWASQLLSHISQKAPSAGPRRGNWGRGGGGQPSAPNFLAIPASLGLARLLRATMESYMGWDADACLQSLLSALSLGPQLDWLLAFVGGAFPASFLQHVLNAGLAHWLTAASPESSRADMEAFDPRLRSVASVLLQLARLRSQELADSLRRLAVDGLKDDASHQARLNMLFLFRLSNSRAEFVQPCLSALDGLVTLPNVLVAAQAYYSIPHRNLYSPRDTAQMVDKLLGSLGPEAQATLLEPLLELSFPSPATPPPASASVAELEDVRRCAERSLLRFADQLARSVNYQAAFALRNESPVLDRLDSRLRDVFVPQLLSPASAKARRVLVSQLLCLNCLARGEQRSLEYCALLLFSASEGSLPFLVCALGFLLTYFPDLVPRLLQRLRPLRESFPEEAAKGRWLDNLRSLVAQERKAAEGAEICDLRLSFHLQSEYAAWLEEVVDFTLEAADGDEGARRRESAVALLELVGAPSPQIPRLLASSLDSLLQLYFLLLEKAERKDEKSLEPLTAMSAYQSLVFGGQEDWARRHVLRRLVQTGVEEMGRLFEDSSLPAKEASPPRLRLLDALRPSKPTKLASLIHSGQIGKGARGDKAKASQSPRGRFRQSLWLEEVEALCRRRAEGPEWAWLAKSLVDVVAKDGIAATNAWLTWDEEKAGLEWLLGTSQRLERLPWAWSALELVAEARPALWHALPLLKARLGAVLARLEAQVDKGSGMGPRELGQVEEWCLLAERGGVLPESLAQLALLLPLISAFEAIALLLEIWRYLQDAMAEAGAEGVPRRPPHPEPYRNVGRLLLHANLPKAGHLYPHLFPSQ